MIIFFVNFNQKYFMHFFRMILLCSKTYFDSPRNFNVILLTYSKHTKALGCLKTSNCPEKSNWFDKLDFFGKPKQFDELNCFDQTKQFCELNCFN